MMLDDAPSASLDGFTPQSILYLVLDTNVLVSDLKLIKQFRLFISDSEDQTTMDVDSKLGDDDSVRLSFVLPWIVLQELDGLKSSRSKDTRFLAQSAIRFIEHCLKNSLWGIVGQKKIKRYDDSVFCNDDYVLDCALEFRQRKECAAVLVLSNDTGLRVKCRVHDIPVVSSDEIPSDPSQLLKLCNV